MLIRWSDAGRAGGKDSTLVTPGSSIVGSSSCGRDGMQVVMSTCRLGGSVAMTGRRDVATPHVELACKCMCCGWRARGGGNGDSFRETGGEAERGKFRAQ